MDHTFSSPGITPKLYKDIRRQSTPINKKERNSSNGSILAGHGITLIDFAYMKSSPSHEAQGLIKARMPSEQVKNPKTRPSQTSMQHKQLSGTSPAHVLNIVHNEQPAVIKSKMSHFKKKASRCKAKLKKCARKIKTVFSLKKKTKTPEQALLNPDASQLKVTGTALQSSSSTITQVATKPSEDDSSSGAAPFSSIRSEASIEAKNAAAIDDFIPSPTSSIYSSKEPDDSAFHQAAKEAFALQPDISVSNMEFMDTYIPYMTLLDKPLPKTPDDIVYESDDESTGTVIHNRIDNSISAMPEEDVESQPEEEVSQVIDLLTFGGQVKESSLGSNITTPQQSMPGTEAPESPTDDDETTEDSTTSTDHEEAELKPEEPEALNSLIAEHIPTEEILEDHITSVQDAILDFSDHEFIIGTEHQPIQEPERVTTFDIDSDIQDSTSDITIASQHNSVSVAPEEHIAEAVPISEKIDNISSKTSDDLVNPPNHIDVHCDAQTLIDYLREESRDLNLNLDYNKFLITHYDSNDDRAYDTASLMTGSAKTTDEGEVESDSGKSNARVFTTSTVTSFGSSEPDEAKKMTETCPESDIKDELGKLIQKEEVGTAFEKIQVHACTYTTATPVESLEQQDSTKTASTHHNVHGEEEPATQVRLPVTKQNTTITTPVCTEETMHTAEIFDISDLDDDKTPRIRLPTTEQEHRRPIINAVAELEKKANRAHEPADFAQTVPLFTIPDRYAPLAFPREQVVPEAPEWFSQTAELFDFGREPVFLKQNRVLRAQKSLAGSRLNSQRQPAHKGCPRAPKRAH